MAAAYPTLEDEGHIDSYTCADRYNFISQYPVVLNHPIDVVYLALAHGGPVIERQMMLSEVCAEFEPGDAKWVEVPCGVVVLRWRTRADAQTSKHGAIARESKHTQPSKTINSDEQSADKPRAHSLPCQAFLMTETIPLYGLFKHRIEVRGWQTWDDDARAALYETEAPFGVVVWKARVFEEIGDEEQDDRSGEDTRGREQRTPRRTRITETLKGRAPAWLRSITQSAMVKIHRCVI